MDQISADSAGTGQDSGCTEVDPLIDFSTTSLSDFLHVIIAGGYTH